MYDELQYESKTGAVAQKNVKVSSNFSESLTHFSAQERGERLCWWYT